MSQKELELKTVQASLKRLDIASEPVLVANDPPDVEFLHGGVRIGVEVTHYHQTRLVGGKFTLRQVEMHWEEFREYAFEYLRANHASLLGYNILLQFRNLSVPKKEDWEAFVVEVEGLLSRHEKAIGDKLTEIQTWNAGPLLSTHLTVIYASRWKAIGRWDSNLNAGSVGASEEELVKIVSSKSTRLQNQNFDANWLLIAGGGRISGTIAAFSDERLNAFERLAECLNASDFAEVHIFDYDAYYIWRRGLDWKSL
ncbi:MAG: hypothetical protein ACE363_13480 [Alphaproteobacteria bacterium]